MAILSKPSALYAFAALFVLAGAAPNADVVSLDKRGQQICGVYDSTSELGGRFYLENNLWGASGYSGSQCSQVTSTNGNSVAWFTKFTWSGGQYQVKSYANLDLQTGKNQRLSSISSIPTTWNWSWTQATNLVADVSYDLWLSPQSGGTGASSTTSYEIMVWLSTRGGAQPAGSQIGTANVNGVTWKLWKGPVSTWTVFSFVAPNEITNYNSDLKGFVNYLVSNQGVSANEWLVQLQAGTEPFTGSGTLTTTSYSCSINTGSTTNPTTSGPNPSGCTVAKYGQCGGSGYTGCKTCASGSTCTYSNEFYSQCL